MVTFKSGEFPIGAHKTLEEVAAQSKTDIAKLLKGNGTENVESAIEGLGDTDEVEEALSSLEDVSEKPERSAELKRAEIGEIANGHALKLIARLAAKKITPADLVSAREDFLRAAKDADPQVDDEAAIRELQETLQSHHDVNLGIGKAELASEIDALKRSMDKAKEVTTTDGKAFIARLEAGEFDANPADADYAIKEYFDAPDDKWLKTGAGEADLLISAKEERFKKLGVRQEKDGTLGGEQAADIKDDEIDDIFGEQFFDKVG